MRPILGIDPGKDGALVLLHVVGSDVEDHLAVKLAPMVGNKRWEAVHTLVSGEIRSMHAAYPIDLAVLELHAGRPGEGAGSARTIGVGWGLLLGVLSGLGVRVIIPTAQSWQRAMLGDLAGEGKDRAVTLCQQRVPGLALVPPRGRVPHTGLAEAACLALYGVGR
jgi:hypothetical protein